MVHYKLMVVYQIAKDIVLQDDVKLLSDLSILTDCKSFGADSDTTYSCCR